MVLKSLVLSPTVLSNNNRKDHSLQPILMPLWLENTLLHQVYPVTVLPLYIQKSTDASPTHLFVWLRAHIFGFWFEKTVLLFCVTLLKKCCHKDASFHEFLISFCLKCTQQGSGAQNSYSSTEILNTVHVSDVLHVQQWDLYLHREFCSNMYLPTE